MKRFGHLHQFLGAHVAPGVPRALPCTRIRTPHFSWPPMQSISRCASGPILQKRTSSKRQRHLQMPTLLGLGNCCQHQNEVSDVRSMAYLVLIGPGRTLSSSNLPSNNAKLLSLTSQAFWTPTRCTVDFRRRNTNFHDDSLYHHQLLSLRIFARSLIYGSASFLCSIFIATQRRTGQSCTV